MIVASMRCSMRKSCIRTRRMRSLTWRSRSTATSLPAAVARPMWNDSSSSTKFGSGGGRSPCAQRAPLVAQRLEDRRVVAGAHPRRALQGLQLQPGPHLVQVAHHGHVGDDRLVAAVGVRGDEALDLQPLERLTDRGARHADAGRPASPRRGGCSAAARPISSLVLRTR